MNRKLVFIFTLALLISVKPVAACTTFCLKAKGEMLFGKNYDFNFADGLVLVNKRGVQKVSVLDEEPNPMKWISKYGSITFNQFGRENPNGGMNEMGLVIEVMWLDETVYPKADKRPTLDVLEWVQYELDTAASVEQVLKTTEGLRIDSDIKIHYLVSDADGNTAAIEFVNGKLVAHTGASLPIMTLTNNTYDDSVKYLSGKTAEQVHGNGSFERFFRAASRVKSFEKAPKAEKEAIDYAFATLADATQPGGTQWSIVYDQKRRKIYFRTLPAPEIKSVDARAFGYGCATAVKVFDMNARASGDVTSAFVDYTRKANRDLIEASFTKTEFLKQVTKRERDMAAAYPEDFACTEQRAAMSVRWMAGPLAAALMAAL